MALLLYTCDTKKGPGYLKAIFTVSLNMLYMKHRHTANPHIAAADLTFHGVGTSPFSYLLIPKYKNKENYILFSSPSKNCILLLCIIIFLYAHSTGNVLLFCAVILPFTLKKG